MTNHEGKICELFLEGPPPTPEEVRRTVLSLPQSSAAKELCTLIEDDLLLQHHFGLFLEVAKLLDLAKHCYGSMMNVAKDRARRLLSRQFALLGMTSCQSQETMLDIFQQLDNDLITATSDMPFVDMLTAIQLEPSLACDVTGILLGASPEEQEFVLLHHIGRLRQEVGTPASIAYAHALREASLAHLHQYMIEAIIQERDSTGVQLLTDLRDHAADDETRRRFQSALLRIGTLQIEDIPGRNTPEATAYVSICDGQGAYFLFCRYKMSPGRSATASCCIRASSDIRDAFVLPGQPDKDFKEMLDRLSAEYLIYTEVPLEHAAMLFSESVERTQKMGKKLPDSAIPVISMFERIVPSTPEEVVPAKTISIYDIYELMDMPHYNSWFFDEGDLDGYGIRPPNEAANSSRSAHSAWLKEAATLLEKTPLKARLLAMLDHMIMWHTWAGDKESASILAAAAKQARSNFKRSAIVKVMLDRSLYNSEDYENIEDDASESYPNKSMDIGSEELRSTIRRRFYNNLKRPSGKHMAELDFTEITYQQLHLSFSSLPGEKRPREDDILDLSHKMAEEFVIALFKGKDASFMISRLEKAAANYTELDFDERKSLIFVLIDTLFGFIDSTCRQCRVQCLHSQRKGMADYFFSVTHPSLIKE